MAKLYSLTTGVDYSAVSAEINSIVESTYPNMGYEFHLIMNNDGNYYGSLSHIGWVVPIVFSGPSIPLGQMGISVQVELMRYKIIVDKVATTISSGQQVDENLILSKISQITKEYSDFFVEQIRLYSTIKKFESYCFEKYKGMSCVKDEIYDIKADIYVADLKEEVNKNINLFVRLLSKNNINLEEADKEVMINNISIDSLRNALSRNRTIYSPYGSFYSSSSFSGGWNRYVLELNHIPNTSFVKSQLDYLIEYSNDPIDKENNSLRITIEEQLRYEKELEQKMAICENSYNMLIA